MLLSNPLLANGLLAYGVAGAVEHLDIIAFIRPNHLIDVGANKGQFSLAALSVARHIKIDCFEPLPAAAAVLERWAIKASANIRIHRAALSTARGSAEFYVTTREDSSSLFRPTVVQQDAGINIKNTINVQTERLDSVLSGENILRPSLLKIDVQGAELDVLGGVGELFDVINYVYVEVSFIELYAGQPLFSEIEKFLKSVGYKLRGFANPYVDRKYGPLQADALFCRSSAAKNYNTTFVD